ncbi:zinc finger, CCHC-type containing protein, partial [Tanacetum coccineum]
VCELLGDGASWSTVVEEGEPVDAVGSGVTTSAIRAMSSGAGRSTLDGGLMGFLEFYKELEAEILGAGAQLMGLQFLQLELRLGKTPSRSFRPVKSAEILWQFWASSSFGVSLAHDGSWSNPIWPKNCTRFAIGKRYLPIESIIASRSTDVMAETKLLRLLSVKAFHASSPKRRAMPASTYVAEQELFETVKAFHACKQEEGQSASTYVLKIKAYLDQMERLGYPMPLVLRVNMILTSLSKDYDQFMQNYNMHGMGKTIPELHAMLKLAKKGIPKKSPAVLAIRQGQIQKPKSQAKGKGKQRGKGKKGIPKKSHAVPPPAKKEHPAKDTECHHCHKTGYWKRNCPLYLAELKKNKANAFGTSGIFTIELFSFPKSNTWIYDTGCGTHICNTIQGLKGYWKLNKGALDLYVGNDHSAAVEAIGCFELILPSGMILILDNCHFSPSITRGI